MAASLAWCHEMAPCARVRGKRPEVGLNPPPDGKAASDQLLGFAGLGGSAFSGSAVTLTMSR